MEQESKNPKDSIQPEIKKSATSHRAPDTTERIKTTREAKLEAAKNALGYQTEEKDTFPEEHIEVGVDKDSPLSAEKMAEQGLTLILPKSTVKMPEKFGAFISAILDPQFSEVFPTYVDMAKGFHVDVRTVKSWLLSKEVGEAIEKGTRHKARLRMPRIIDAVAIRAEITGDPHAANFVAEQAGMRRIDQGSDGSFEKTLKTIKDIALARAAASAGGSSPSSDPPIDVVAIKDAG